MGEGEVRGVSVTYHLTDPARIAMGERKELVREIRTSLPDAKVTYVTMFPRHVVRCCSEPGHMTEEDAAMGNGFRKTGFGQCGRARRLGWDECSGGREGNG